MSHRLSNRKVALSILAVAACFFFCETNYQFVSMLWRTTRSKLYKSAFLFAAFIPDLADSITDAIYFGTMEKRKSLVTIPSAVFYAMTVFLFIGRFSFKSVLLINSHIPNNSYF